MVDRAIVVLEGQHEITSIRERSMFAIGVTHTDPNDALVDQATRHMSGKKVL
jgi:hypothetical protein